MGLLDGPGEGFGAENGDGSLPDDSSPLANLNANFTPNLDNLIPSSTASSYMPDSLASFFDNGGGGAYPGATTIGNTGSDFSGLTSFLGNAGTSLLNAFVVNPQNEQTAAAAATTQAELSAVSTSQIFSYLLIGVVIFAIFGALGKK